MQIPLGRLPELLVLGIFELIYYWKYVANLYHVIENKLKRVNFIKNLGLMMKKNDLMIPVARIENKILHIREQKVLLDSDLAVLYGVSTGNFNKAVTRNIDRFPEDFMFMLTREELNNLIFQNGTSSWGGTRKLPRVFTEQGVAMLSGILHSPRAVSVNIAIMRAFVRMREMLLSNAKLAAELRDIEGRIDTQEMNTILLMDRLRAVEKKIKGSALNPKDKKKIGFHRE